MARKVYNIYWKICDPQTVCHATYLAVRGKSKRHDVKRLIANGYIEAITEVWELLDAETFKCSDYEQKEIFDGKRRLLTIAPLHPDRIVHHCIVDVTEPYLWKLFVPQTYACIKGRGIHKCLEDLTRYLQEDKCGTRYCLKIDIRHYYDSIEHTTLKRIMAHYFGDQRLLRLMYQIVDSTEGDVGLPIGFLTSQHWANLYLTPFDHWLKEKLGVRYYLRYMDDIVILHRSKKYLHYVLEEMREYLRRELQLAIKPNWQIFPVDARSIDFVGYKSNHYNTLARRSILYRYWRKLRRVQERYSIFELDSLWQTLSAHNGWLQHCTPEHYNKIISETIKQILAMTNETLKRGLHSNEVQPTFDVIDRIKGTTLYNHNQHWVENTDEQGNKVRQNEYDSLLVMYPVTANTVFEALLTARYNTNYEQKLLNDYNAAQAGIEDEGKQQPYLDFLAERKALRAMVDADCQIAGIPME